MEKFIRFRTEKTDGRIVYIDPTVVVALEEDGDTHTSVYVSGTENHFSVWGKIDIVHATLTGNNDPYG